MSDGGLLGLCFLASLAIAAAICRWWWLADERRLRELREIERRFYG